MKARHSPTLELKAKTLCKLLLRGEPASTGLGTAEAAFTLVHAVEKGWVRMRPFGLTDAGREIATHSRSGPRAKRSLALLR